MAGGSCYTHRTVARDVGALQTALGMYRMSCTSGEQQGVRAASMTRSWL